MPSAVWFVVSLVIGFAAGVVGIVSTSLDTGVWKGAGAFLVSLVGGLLWSGARG